MNADLRSQVTKVLKVAIVGPECTGKTTLAQQLAKRHKTAWVPEFARDYLNQLRRPYQQHDLIDIAKGQLSLEDDLANQASAILICDTNLLVIKIWSEFKYGSCDPWILNQVDERKYDIHFLTNIDTPWEEDPQREHPHLRHELFNLYKQELESRDLVYVELSGNETQRLNTALAAIENILNHE